MECAENVAPNDGISADFLHVDQSDANEVKDSDSEEGECKSRNEFENLVLDWVLDIILPGDAEDYLLFALRVLKVDKATLIEIVKEAIHKGASKCIRHMTPLTGPQVLCFQDTDWVEIRRETLAAVGILNERVDRAILEVVNIPWVSWTRNLPGLLRECVTVKNYKLAKQLVQKGYMEGTAFGEVLNCIWEELEKFDEYSKEERKLLSGIFDDITNLIRDCKEETLLCAEEHENGYDSDEQSSLWTSSIDDDGDQMVDDIIEQRAKTCRYCTHCAEVGRKRLHCQDDDDSAQENEHVVKEEAGTSWFSRIYRIICFPWYVKTYFGRDNEMQYKKHVAKRAKLHAE